MADENVVSSLTVKADGDFASEAERMAAAGEKAAASIEAIGSSAETTTTKVSAADRTFVQLTNRYDPLTVKQNQFNRMLAEEQRLMDSASRAKADGSFAADKYAGALTTIQDRQAKLAGDIAGLTQAVSAQSMSLDAARAKWVPLVAEQQRSIAAQTEINTLVRQGSLTMAEGAAAIDRVTAAYAKQAQAVQSAAAAAATANSARGQNIANSFAGFSEGSAPPSARDSAANLADSLDRLRLAYDPVASAQQRYAAALRDITVLEANELLSMDAATRARQTARDAYENVALASERAAQAQAEEAQKADAATAALQRQQAVLSAVVAGNRAAANTPLNANGQVNLYAATPDGLDVSKSAADSASVFAQQQKEADAARASVDSLFRISKEYEAELDRISDAVQKSGLSEAYADTLRQRAAQNMTVKVKTDSDAATKAREVEEATTRQSAAFRALAPQIVQTVTSVQAGIPWWQAFIQQGHQVADIALVQGLRMKDFGNLASAAASRVGSALVGPLGLVGGFVAAAAAIAGMTVYAERQQETLAKLSNTMKATRDDASSMAAEAIAAGKALADQPGWNRTTALQATSSIGSNSYFSGSSTALQQLSQLAQDVGTRLGTDLAGGLTQVNNALNDPVAELQALYARHLPGVSESLIVAAQKAEATGDRVGAVAIAMQALSDSAAHATHDSLTPFQQSLEQFKTAVHPLVDLFERMASAIGGGVLDALTRFINSLAIWHTGTSAYGQAADGVRETSAMGAYGRPNDGVRSTAANPYGTTLAAPAAAVVINQASGAYGIGQIMPSNFAAVRAQGYDPGTTTGNIYGSAYLFADQLRLKHGNTDAAIAGYGGFVSDPTGMGASDYISKTYAKSGVSNLPSAIQDVVRSAAQKYGIDPDLLAGTLMTESGGSQFAGGASRSSALPAALSYVNAGKIVADQGAAAANDNQSYAAQDAKLRAQQTALEAAMKQPGLSADTLTRYQQALDKVNAAIYANVDANTKNARSQQDALAQAQALTGYQRSMVQADQEADAAAQQEYGRNATRIEQLTYEAAARRQLTAEVEVSTAAINRATASQNAAIDSYDASQGSLQHYTNLLAAQNDLQDKVDLSSDEGKRLLEDRVAAMDRASASAENLALAQSAYGNSLNIDLLKTEIGLVGQDSDAVAVQVAVLQKRNEILAAHGDLSSKESQIALQQAAETAQLTVQYQHQQQVMSDLSSSFSSIATTIGDDITQAFVQGSGSAVNFSNILKGIESQLVSMAVKFGVINPLMNSLTGQHNTTLGDLTGLLGSVGGQTTAANTPVMAGSILSGNFGYSGLTAYSATGNAASTDQPSLLSQLGSLPGAFGAGGVVKGLGSVGSWLNTKPSWLGGNTSYAGAIGAAGYGLNGILGFTKGGTGNVISGIGSTAAAAMSFIPGLQAFAPIAAIGGSLLGSLFGGHPKNPYTIDNVQVSGGQLALGQTWNQAQNDTITTQLKSDIASINTTLQSLGVTFKTDGQIGSVRNDPNNKNSALQSTTLQQQLAGVGLTSNQASLNTILSTGLPSSYDSVASFQQTIASMKDMADTVDALGVSVTNFDKDTQKLSIGSFTGSTTYSQNAATAIGHATFGKTFTASDLASTVQAAVTFADTTYPGLINATLGTTQTYADQIASMQATYQAAITQAQAYGLSIDALTAKQQSLTADMWKQAQYGLDSANDNMQVRYLTATGQTRTAELLQHDTQADADYKALDASYQAIYGAAWQSAATYERDRTQLIQTESAERLAIEQKYQDAATAAAQQAADAQQQALQTAAGNASSFLGGLTSYAKSFALSDDSPLSASDRYSTAKSAWEIDLAKAQNGDTTAMGNLTDDANAFYAQSRTYNGSNVQSANDYQAILAGLQSVVMRGAGQLTQDFMTADTQQQTDAINAKLDEVKGVLMDLLQTSRRAA